MSDEILYDNTVCYECGNAPVEHHHIVPKSLGGTKTIPLCYVCHGHVHDRNFVKHRALTRAGIERAKLEGKYTGRSENIVRNKKMTKMLNDGLSYTTIQKITGASRTTIAKLSKRIKEQAGP